MKDLIWQQKLAAYLLLAGTTGKREAEITHRFHYVPKEEVVLELEALWAEEKVQRFTIDNKRVWRATVELND